MVLRGQADHEQARGQQAEQHRRRRHEHRPSRPAGSALVLRAALGPPPGDIQDPQARPATGVVVFGLVNSERPPACSALIAGTSAHLGREIRGSRQGLVKELVKEFAQARVPQDGGQAQAPVNVPADPGSEPGGQSCRQRGG